MGTTAVVNIVTTVVDLIIRAVGFCLSGDTLVTVLGKERIYKKPVSEVGIGELIQTYNGNDLVYSEVISNTVDEGPKNFFTFKIKDKKSNIKSISTTENHPMIIFKEESNKINIKYANKIRLGDLVRTTEGLGEIIEIRNEIKNNSYRLRVEQGTVLANDILVGAFYAKEDEINQKKLNKILDTTRISIENKN